MTALFSWLWACHDMFVAMEYEFFLLLNSVAYMVLSLSIRIVASSVPFCQYLIYHSTDVPNTFAAGRNPVPT